MSIIRTQYEFEVWEEDELIKVVELDLEYEVERDEDNIIDAQLVGVYLRGTGVAVSQDILFDTDLESSYEDVCEKYYEGCFNYVEGL